jgi:hypothetical protein
VRGILAAEGVQADGRIRTMSAAPAARIRAETVDDHKAIRHVNEPAFSRAEEADLVES